MADDILEDQKTIQSLLLQCVKHQEIKYTANTSAKMQKISNNFCEEQGERLKTAGVQLSLIKKLVVRKKDFYAWVLGFLDSALS